MKNKIFAILICALLLMLSSISVIQSIDTKTKTKCEETPHFTTESYAVTTNQASKITFDSFQQNYAYTMDEQSILSKPDVISPKPSIVNVPAEFSWRNYNGQDWTSPIKRQGCGDCWLFAAIGCLESIINVREGYANLDPDLSEQFVLSCFPQAGSCQGGFSWKAYKYMMDTSPAGLNHNGALLESCFNYIGVDAAGCDYYDCDNDPVLCSEKCDDWVNHLVPIKNYTYWNPDGSAGDIDRIKSEIFEKGPVVTSYLADDEFSKWVSEHHGTDEYFPYRYAHSINHCVVIVGWKDDPSIPRGGYWICKNSWGMYSGYDGFFNIEYGSLSIDSWEIVEVDYDPTSYDWPPVADAGGLYSGAVSSSILFDATNSFDAEGGIVSYTWDFGDGTTATGITASHTYSKRGTYLVTLEVIDAVGESGYDETNAFIDFWKIDDSWTYDVSVAFETEGGIAGDYDFAFNDVVLTVTDVTANEYLLHFAGELTGDFTAGISQFTVVGIIRRSIPIEGNLVINKETFGIKQISVDMSGKISIGFPSPSVFKLPFSFTLVAQLTIEDEIELFNLPFQSSKTTDIPLKSYEVTGEFSSIWLRLLSLVNKLSGGSLLPPEVADLLPIIDLSKLFENSKIPGYRYRCAYNGFMTIPPGTFETYGITLKAPGFDAISCQYYFAPELCNVIVFNAAFDKFTTPAVTISGTINAELTSFNYT